MLGGITNACGLIMRLAVLSALRRHAPSLAPLCAAQFARNRTVAVIPDREQDGRKCELQYSVATEVWQRSMLSSPTFRLTCWSRMKNLLDRVNYEKPVMGSFSYVDDFTRMADEERADQLWNQRGEASAEVGLEIDQSRGVLNQTSANGMGTIHIDRQGEHRSPCHSGHGAQLDDDGRTRRYQSEGPPRKKAGEFAGHVETVTTLRRGITTRSVS